jgi:signal transduction histidine kinase
VGFSPPVIRGRTDRVVHATSPPTTDDVDLRVGLDLPSSRRSPALARSVVTVALRDHPSMAERLALITSELVANAVQHAPGDVHVELLVDDGLATVEVTDSGAGEPANVTSPSGVSGRGLAIVVSEAARCGWFRAADGSAKTVWATVDDTARDDTGRD